MMDSELVELGEPWRPLSTRSANATLSPKASAFAEALRALCAEHEVAVSVECDGLVSIDDLEPGADALSMPCIVDNTRP
jgi:hypothetical protein